MEDSRPDVPVSGKNELSSNNKQFPNVCGLTRRAFFSPILDFNIYSQELDGKLGNFQDLVLEFSLSEADQCHACGIVPVC